MSQNFEIKNVQLLEINAKYPTQAFAELSDDDEVALKVNYKVNYHSHELSKEPGTQFKCQTQFTLQFEGRDEVLANYIANFTISLKATVGTTNVEDAAKELALLSYPFAREAVSSLLVTLGLPTPLPYSPPV